MRTSPIDVGFIVACSVARPYMPRRIITNRSDAHAPHAPSPPAHAASIRLFRRRRIALRRGTRSREPRCARKIELPRPTAPGTRKFSELNRERQEIALAAALQAAADVIAKDLFEQLTKTKGHPRPNVEILPRLAEEEKLREGAMRSFDSPLKDGLAREQVHRT